MDIYKEERPSNLKGASKGFKRRLQAQSWQTQGSLGFITMTHRDKCGLCEQYAEHAVAAAEKPTVAILSHQIELTFQMAWPQVVTCIEDEAMD